MTKPLIIITTFLALLFICIGINDSVEFVYHFIMWINGLVFVLSFKFLLFFYYLKIYCKRTEFTSAEKLKTLGLLLLSAIISFVILLIYALLIPKRGEDPHFSEMIAEVFTLFILLFAVPLITDTFVFYMMSLKVMKEKSNFPLCLGMSFVIQTIIAVAIIILSFFISEISTYTSFGVW